LRELDQMSLWWVNFKNMKCNLSPASLLFVTAPFPVAVQCLMTWPPSLDQTDQSVL